jgi:hypothetical protein
MSGSLVMPKRAWHWALLALLLLPGPARSAGERPVTLVGMHGRLEGIVLPGHELEVRPLEHSQAPFVLRIDKVYPHGTAFRYDFVYYALEPRVYDVTKYLRTKDGSPLPKLPPLEVEVNGLLGPGLIHPQALEAQSTTWFASYHWLLILGGIVWVGGFLAILLWGRGKKRASGQQAAGPESMADRLRPLVVRAMTGRLSASQQAELERMLLAFWRRRLGLEKEKAPAALAALRQHPEAGVLLQQLELWLHRPGAAQQVDVGKLLWPYREAAPEGPVGASSTPGGTA